MVCIEKFSVKISGNYSDNALILFAAYASLNTIRDQGMNVMRRYNVLNGMTVINNNHIHTLLKITIKALNYATL